MDLGGLEGLRHLERLGCHFQAWGLRLMVFLAPEAIGPTGMDQLFRFIPCLI